MIKEFLNKLSHNILVLIDEGVNVFVIPAVTFVFRLPKVQAEGRASFTVSQWLGELRNKGSKFGCIGCKILTFIQNRVFRIDGDHCMQSLDARK